jgi:2-haloalkanoic acid dehalogenase type II
VSPPRPRIRAVLFDLGGTLVDEWDFNHVAELARRLYLDLRPDDLLHHYREVERRLDEHPPSGNREARLAELWREVLSGAAGRDLGLEVGEKFRHLLLEEERPVHLFSDVRRCLDRLRGSDRLLAVVSNSTSEAGLRRILDRAGILGYFRRVVSSGTEGVAKPDPEIFRRTVERLAVPPAEALHVGNLEYADAKAATSAGLHALWLNRFGLGLGVDPPEISSLLEVPVWVRRYERGTA